MSGVASQNFSKSFEVRLDLISEDECESSSVAPALSTNPMPAHHYSHKPPAARKEQYKRPNRSPVTRTEVPKLSSNISLTKIESNKFKGVQTRKP